MSALDRRDHDRCGMEIRRIPVGSVFLEKLAASGLQLRLRKALLQTKYFEIVHGNSLNGDITGYGSLPHPFANLVIWLGKDVAAKWRRGAQKVFMWPYSTNIQSMRNKTVMRNAMIDWESLSKAAAEARADLWNTVTRAMEHTDEVIPDCNAAVRTAYVDLRLDYPRAREMVRNGVTPDEEDLDPLPGTEDMNSSAFVQKVLAAFDRLDFELRERGIKADDEEASKRLLDELMKTGQMDNPLT